MSQLSNLFKKIHKFESKNYKKIDLFIDGKYVCSTLKAKTCKEAIARFRDLLDPPNGKITARFALDK